MLQAPAFSRFRESVTVWPDDTYFYRFYPVAEVPQIRRGDDGLPVLLLVEYALSDDDRRAKPELPPGGGYLTVDTALTIDEETLTALRAELQTWVDAEWARLRAGTPAQQALAGVAGTDVAPRVEFGTPTWTKGSVHLDAPQNERLVDARIGEGVPSLLGGNAATFSLDLTPAGAEFVRQTLLTPGAPDGTGSAGSNISPLQVGYDLTMWARLPPAGIHIEVDLRRSYEHIRRQWQLRGLLFCSAYWFDTATPTIEALTQTGAVTVRIDSGSGGLTEDTIDKLRGYALDLVKNMLQTNIFAASGKPASGGPQTYALRDDDDFRGRIDSSTTMKLTVDLVQSSVVEMTVHPKATLQGQLDTLDAATRGRLLRRINLDDDFFDSLDVTVRAFADFGPADGKVSHVDVELAYPEAPTDGGAPRKGRSFTLTSEAPEHWAPGLLDGLRTFSYRWRSVSSGQPAPDFGPWEASSSDRAVNLVIPPPGLIDMQVTAVDIDFDAVVRQCQVELRYGDEPAGVPVEVETLVLTKAAPTARYRRQLTGPVRRTPQWRVGWVLLDNDRRPLGEWTDVPGPNLLVSQPDTPLLRVSVMPGGNGWSEVVTAVVDVRYADQGVDVTHSPILTAADQFRIVTFLPPKNGVRTFSHRRHVSYRSGRFETTPWQDDVDDPFLPVVLTKPGFEVVVDGTLLDLAAAPLTEVNLSYDSSPPQQQNLSFRSPNVLTWQVDAPAGAPVSYRWQVVHHPANRDPVTLPAVEERDTLAVLPPYRAAVSGELAVEVVTSLVRFNETPLVAVDLRYDDHENAYHRSEHLLLDDSKPKRTTWRIPTRDARLTAFGYTVTYFTPDGQPHPGPRSTPEANAAPAPHVVVPALPL